MSQGTCLVEARPEAEVGPVAGRWAAAVAQRSVVRAQAGERLALELGQAAGRSPVACV